MIAWDTAGSVTPGEEGVRPKVEMDPPERNQPAFDGLLPVLDAGRRSQGLGRNSAHGRERILDAMMQFFDDELLQLVSGFTLLGVNAGLREQRLGVNAGLFEQ